MEVLRDRTIQLSFSLLTRRTRRLIGRRQPWVLSLACPRIIIRPWVPLMIVFIMKKIAKSSTLETKQLWVANLAEENMKNTGQWMPGKWKSKSIHKRKNLTRPVLCFLWWWHRQKMSKMLLISPLVVLIQPILPGKWVSERKGWGGKYKTWTAWEHSVTSNHKC